MKGRLSIKRTLTLWFTAFMALTAGLCLGLILITSGQVARREAAERLDLTVRESIPLVNFSEGSLSLDPGFRFYRNNVYLIWKNMPFLQIVLNSPFFLAGFALKALFFLKKGYGRVYAGGLKEGIALCASPEGRAGRVRFKGRNLGNYIRIQAQLWINIFRRL